jgi:hypothetical protein
VATGVAATKQPLAGARVLAHFQRDTRERVRERHGTLGESELHELTVVVDGSLNLARCG